VQGLDRRFVALVAIEMGHQTPEVTVLAPLIAVVA